MSVEQRTSRGNIDGPIAAVAVADDVRGRELARRLLALVDRPGLDDPAETGVRPPLEGAPS